MHVIVSLRPPCLVPLVGMCSATYIVCVDLVFLKMKKKKEWKDGEK